MSVLLIVGAKCTRAASHCESCEYADRTDRRTPDRYITLSARRRQCTNAASVAYCTVEAIADSLTTAIAKIIVLVTRKNEQNNNRV